MHDPGRPQHATHEAAAPVRKDSSVDVAAAAGLAVLAAVAVALLEPGSAWRVALAVPVFFLVPGYLLLQAALVPARPWRTRGVHALVALGLSPPLVGLAALATALVYGGFGATLVVLTTTILCVGLAGMAAYRRRRAHANDGKADQPAGGAADAVRRLRRRHARRSKTAEYGGLE